MKIDSILESSASAARNLTGDDYWDEGPRNLRYKLRNSSPAVKKQYRQYIDDVVAKDYITVRQALDSTSLKEDDPRRKRIEAAAPPEQGIDHTYIWRSFGRQFVKVAIGKPKYAYKNMTETRKDMVWDQDHISTFFDSIGYRNMEEGYGDDYSRAEASQDEWAAKKKDLIDSNYITMWDLIEDLIGKEDSRWERLAELIPKNLVTQKYDGGQKHAFEDIYVKHKYQEDFQDMILSNPVRAMTKFGKSAEELDAKAEEHARSNADADYENRNPYSSRGLTRR